MTSHEPDRAPSRRVKLVGLLLLTTVGMIASCAGDDTPAVCDSLETLRGDVDQLQELDPQVGEGAVADIEDSLDSIRTSLETVKEDAEAELSEPIAGLETSLEAVSADLDSIQAAGDVTSASVQALVDSLAAVSTSWEALAASAPDCDL